MKIKKQQTEEFYYVLQKDVKAPSFFKDFGTNFKIELTPYPDDAWYMRSDERLQRYFDEYSEHLKGFKIVRVTQRVLTEYDVE